MHTRIVGWAANQRGGRPGSTACCRADSLGGGQAYPSLIVAFCPTLDAMARVRVPVAGDLPLANCVVHAEHDDHPSCTFCRRAPGRSWSDWATVRMTGAFVIVAPLGSIVPGYVLILPAGHVASFAELDAADYEAARSTLEDIVATYRSAGYGEYSVFEHGCRTGQPAAGCIDHAHWHVVPVDLRLSPCVQWRRVSGFDEARRVSAALDEYLFVRNSSAGFFLADRVPGRQFLRQSLAAQLGRPDEWDYLVFPHLGNLRSTLDLFG